MTPHFSSSIEAGGQRGYCRKCGYQLSGLLECRCPECGSEFDWNNQRTFSVRPPRGAIWKWGCRVAGLLFLLVAIGVAGLGWLWHEWKGEQEAVAQLRARGAKLQLKSIVPERLGSLLGARFKFLCDRVVDVKLSGRSGSGISSINFGSMGHLEHLTLTSFDLNDEACAHIGEAKSLGEIELHGISMKDSKFDFLSRLPQLAKLQLVNVAVDEDAITSISQCRRLKLLKIDCVPIPNDAIRKFVQLSALEELSVAGSGITESEIDSVKEMKSLRRLDVRETRIHDKKLKELKQALPGLKIWGNFVKEW